MFGHICQFPSSLFDVSSDVCLEVLATRNQMKRIIYMIKILHSSWFEHCGKHLQYTVDLNKHHFRRYMLRPLYLLAYLRTCHLMLLLLESTLLLMKILCFLTLLN